MWEPTWSTPRLLAEREFLYDFSLMDADLPYELAVTGAPAMGPIVEIPIHWALDDWEQYFFLPDISGDPPIESPRKERQASTASPRTRLVRRYAGSRHRSSVTRTTCSRGLRPRSAIAADVARMVNELAAAAPIRRPPAGIIRT